MTEPIDYEAIKDTAYANTHITATELAELLDIPRSKAIAIMAVLASRRCARVMMNVYCDACATGVRPSDCLPFGEGFPQGPYVCLSCGKVHETLDGLRFEVGATSVY